MTEGAGGLGTANLAAVLDALDDDEPIGLWQFEEAARAELAALVEAARRSAALAAAQEAVIAAARAYLAYIDYRYDGSGMFVPPRELVALADALTALDAVRAGGAGETDKEG
jgi:hypothetical protein